MKEKIKMIVVFGLGILVSSGVVYAATLYSATEVSYDNTSSGTSMVNVQGALDELYVKANFSYVGTAQPEDVLAGKTFYSNSNTLQTGTRKESQNVYEGYQIVSNRAKPIYTTTIGGYEKSETLPNTFIPLSIRIVWTVASLNHSHTVGFNGTYKSISGLAGNTYDITLDIETDFQSFSQLKQNTSNVLYHSDPYAMSTTFYVTRWAVKVSN